MTIHQSAVLWSLCTALMFAVSPLTAWGLSTDKNKPMEILANSAELDDKNRVTIYRGDVEVTQGTLFMSGHTLTVYYDEDQELDHAVMEGDRAYYKQLPDNSKVYDEAWARRMEYYSDNGLIVLIEDAKVVQEDVRFTGARIEYDTINSRIKARSARTAEKPDAATDKPQDADRVRVIIKPKKKSTDSE